MDTKALRQKILDLAIRGKLVPQDPNDEPASVLLEHIREQKKQMVKDGKLKPKDIKNDTIIFNGDDNLHYEKFQDGTVRCIEDEIPFEVPEGWEWTRLSNIASFSGGKTPSTSDKTYWGNDVLWVTSKDMKTKYIESSLMMLSDLGAKQLQIYPIGTLLMVVRSGILRHTLPLSILSYPATINQDLKAINFYYNGITEYIYFCLKAFEKNILQKYTKAGATVENIEFNSFKNIILPIAPEKQMESITSKTNDIEKVFCSINKSKNSLYHCINNAKSKILDLAIRGKLVPQDPNDEPASALLERIKSEKEKLIKQGKIKRNNKQSVIFKGDDNSYYEKIGNTVTCIDDEIPFETPINWQWVRLGSTVEIERGGSPRPIKSYITTDSSGINWIKIGDVDKEGKYITNTKEKIKPTGIKKSREVHPGDFLLTNSMSFGRPYISKIYGCIHDGWLVLRNPNVVFDINFLYYLLSSNCLYNQFVIKASGSTVDNLNIDKVSSALICLPPIKEQIKIVNQIEKIMRLIQPFEELL